MPRGRSSFIDLILDRVEDAADDLVDSLLHDLKRELPRIQAQAGVETRESGPRRSRKRRTNPRPRPQERPTAPKGPTLYDDLEVSPRASHETIKAAHRSLAMRYHPDKGADPTGGRMRMINEAWSILQNPEKRKKYDKSIGL